MSGNLEDVAYHKIKKAISKGYIKKGTQLKEVSLARTLNMSRATVKGAIKRLVYEGLAEHEPNKSVSVVNPSLEEIQETFQVRAQLEKMATFLAAKKLNPDDLAELNRLINKEEHIFSARELDQYYTLNNAFHLKIAEKSGNRVLLHYVKDLLQKTTIYLILFDPFYQILDENNSSPHEHQAIVRWLEKRDGAQAAAAMENHLGNSMSGIDLKRLLPHDYLTI